MCVCGWTEESVSKCEKTLVLSKVLILLNLLNFVLPHLYFQAKILQELSTIYNFTFL